MNTKLSSEKLADELFILMRADQDRAFISAGLCAKDVDDIFEAAQTALFYSKCGVKKLERWLKKYGRA